MGNTSQAVISAGFKIDDNCFIIQCLVNDTRCVILIKGIDDNAKSQQIV